MKEFFTYRDIPYEELGNGIKRKILAHDNPLMVVEVTFEKGASGDPHSHENTQLVYILEGEFEFDVDGEKKRVSKGDTVFIKSNKVHSAICLESGKVLDIFTPERKDFL